MVGGHAMVKKCQNQKAMSLTLEKYLNTTVVKIFRFFMMREVPFGQDGDFSQRLIDRMNSDLSNDLGNPIKPYHRNV